jgi:hypothetical protein
LIQQVSLYLLQYIHVFVALRYPAMGEILIMRKLSVPLAGTRRLETFPT